MVCGYKLDLPRRGGSYEYQQFFFCSKRKYPSLLYKSGVNMGKHVTYNHVILLDGFLLSIFMVKLSNRKA